MKKSFIFVLSVVFMAAVSCRDTEKDAKELEVTLDRIESVEQEIDETTEALDQKAQEVEFALSELDSL